MLVDSVCHKTDEAWCIFGKGRQVFHSNDVKAERAFVCVRLCFRSIDLSVAPWQPLNALAVNLLR